ncbi:MAG: biotin transporter BioY [Actinomycetales bacterium]|nr:MAG: biotin transporter BioY [Actinomycetales bacterium]
MSQVSNLRTALIQRASIATQISLILTGTVFLALMAQISFPIPGSPVPFTGQTLGVLLLGTAYGASLGFSTMAFYLLMGILGAPIFAAGSHGLEKIAGATGGYLVGMLISTLVLGALAGRKWDQKIKTVIPTMIIGNSVVFTFGLIWLHQYTGQSWAWTFEKGFTPFIFGEVLKIAIASTALPVVWRFVSKR